MIDVGLSFGPSAKKEGLIQPYKVSTWDSIPDDQKDPEGYWYGDYYGVLAFEVNKDMIKNIPADWYHRAPGGDRAKSVRFIVPAAMTGTRTLMARGTS